MPKIVIKEKDNTTSGLVPGTNFSVVVPGFWKTNGTVFDENGVYECNDAAEFLTKIGAVPAKEITLSDTTTKITSYGNQMAYELLSLGYTVLYLNLGQVTENEGTWSLVDETKLADFRSSTCTLLDPLKDRSAYDFRFIVTGFTKETNNEYAKNIIKLAHYHNGDELTKSGRGDVLALVDVDEDAYANKTTQAEVIKAIQLEANKIEIASDDCAGKDAAILAPTFCANGLASQDTDKYGTGNDLNTCFPASFYYLACFSRSVRDLSFAEWYAVAGFTRGKSNLRVVSTKVKLGEIAGNLLQPRKQIAIETVSGTTTYLKRAVNIIANFRENFVLWGNRTAYDLQTGETAGLIASHFLNIRQLCITLKKDIYEACRRFTFDPNSDTLWVNFCNALRPTLEAMKADQGIEDYDIIKVETNEKGILKARVRIVPIEAVEDFEIEVSLEDSLGGETTIVVAE